ncbi:hypothetical protein SAMN04489725_101244 [Alicyclobacillus hesperidum]|uniref:Uncharacterized protein n=1 Tax=Alicyclobacillus hesperidum TaxID=89784 RepID=A0A1H2QFR5_9BACL|nr:hypothetical protein SAMN04489725_101244 [Alicyclobacillus hesperidum]
MVASAYGTPYLDTLQLHLYTYATKGVTSRC